MDHPRESASRLNSHPVVNSVSSTLAPARIAT